MGWYRQHRGVCSAAYCNVTSKHRSCLSNAIKRMGPVLRSIGVHIPARTPRHLRPCRTSTGRRCPRPCSTFLPDDRLPRYGQSQAALLPAQMRERRTGLPRLADRILVSHDEPFRHRCFVFHPNMSTPPCPLCGEPVQRIHRHLFDRLLSLVHPARRYRCPRFRCGWEGTLRYRADPNERADTRDLGG